MRRAIGLTRDTHPHPNPRVGAIVLSPQGEIVAERAHQRAGEAHAEAAALAEAGPAAHGATLVCTLEPCSHHGRTPPCVDAIIESGIATVVVGALDPDRRVAGRGIAALRAAGINVVTDVATPAVLANDPGYFHQRTTGRPLVTLKSALTLDGQAAAADGTARWITGPAAREDGHRLRSESDVILVGAGTVISDDPRLDVRLENYHGPHPRPVIVAGRRPLPPDAQLLQRDALVVTDGIHEMTPPGVAHVSMPGRDGVDLDGLIAYLGAQGVLTVLIEGGPTLAGSAIRAGLVDHLVLYYGPKLGVGTGIPGIAGTFRTIAEARPVTVESVTVLGDDLKIEATIEKEA
jgi:diaminohydroxyphosphoribosylaminopyrimidine deaminase/5-amino-6-(5-phosphoribosylamino)uracil reductase